jgi:hypothetical protein
VVPQPGGVGHLGTTVPGSAPAGSPQVGTSTISRFDVAASIPCTPGADAQVRADIETDGLRTQLTVDNKPAAEAPPTTTSTWKSRSSFMPASCGPAIINESNLILRLQQVSVTHARPGGAPPDQPADWGGEPA